MLMPPPPDAGYGAGRQPDTNPRLILIAVVAAAILIAVGGVGVIMVMVVGHGPSLRAATASPKASSGAPVRGLITPATRLTPEAGTIVFTDDFRDPQSGWDTSAIVPGVSYSFANGAFVSVAKGAYIYFEPSPYTEPKQQLSVGATATLDIHTPPDAGFGVDCWRGSGAAQVTYQFYAAADSSWYVLKFTGTASDTNFPTTLKEGSIKGSPAPGVIPLTLVGVCATMADATTTRLALFINGSKVADLTDTSPAFTGDAWATDLLVSGSDTGPVTVTVTHFEERDLSRGSG